MSNTFKFGNGNWAYKDGKVLAYNDLNNNFKPLPFDFTRASSATRVNKAGLIESVTEDIPRVDYLNDSNGALLLEPSRTNEITYSEDFSQSAWSKTNITVDSNSITSPDGTQNASKIIPTTTNGQHLLDRGGFNRVSGQYISHTIYAKAAEYNYIYLSDAAARLYGVYDLSNGTVVYNGSNGTDFNNHSASIESVGNGWYRCTLVGQAQLSASAYFRLSTASVAVDYFDAGIFSGDGTSGVYIWGAQVESDSSYATSYIPTNGSTVTRLPETCTSAGNNQVFGVNGTIFFETSSLFDDGTNRILSLSDGTNNNRINFYYRATSNQLLIRSTVNLVSNTDITYNMSDTTIKAKFAINYDSSTLKVYLNGNQIGSVGSSSFPSSTLDRFSFTQPSGSSTESFLGNISNVKIYNEALTDTQLQALTS